jgi:hypothetical protein
VRNAATSSGEKHAIETEAPLYNDKHNRRNPLRVVRDRISA